MDYRIRVKNGGATYRVPEDMVPRVAEAMVQGGTAEVVEEKSIRTDEAAGRVVESASVRPAAQQAARTAKPRPAGRTLAVAPGK